MSGKKITDAAWKLMTAWKGPKPLQGFLPHIDALMLAAHIKKNFSARVDFRKAISKDAEEIGKKEVLNILAAYLKASNIPMEEWPVLDFVGFMAGEGDYRGTMDPNLKNLNLSPNDPRESTVFHLIPQQLVLRWEKHKRIYVIWPGTDFSRPREGTISTGLTASQILMHMIIGGFPDDLNASRTSFQKAFEKMEPVNLDEYEAGSALRFWGYKASVIDATQKSLEQVVDDWLDKK